MCDPVSIAGAALAVGGGAMQMAGQAKQMKARQKAINAENERQAGYQQQSLDLFNQTLPKAGVDAEAERRSAAEDRRVGEDTAAIQGGTRTPVLATGTAPDEIKEANARALRKAMAEGVDRAKRQARFASYGESTGDLSRDLLHAGQWQQIFGNNALRSAAVLPSELNAANYKGAGLMAGGSLLSGLGKGAGAWGASGGWGSLFGNQPKTFIGGGAAP